jgi:hypothetical protein
MVISHAQHEALLAKQRASGLGMEAYLKSEMRKKGILPR